jgi:hypothetical protein
MLSTILLDNGIIYRIRLDNIRKVKIKTKLSTNISGSEDRFIQHKIQSPSKKVKYIINSIKAMLFTHEMEQIYFKHWPE